MRLAPEGRDSVGLIAVWAVIGALMVASTGVMLRNAFRDPQGWLGWAAAVYAAPGPLMFFVVGIVAIAAAGYALIDQARNRMWLEVAAPIRTGGALRARLISSRPLASRRDQAIQAEFACRLLQQQDEVVLWRERQEIPLSPHQTSCALNFELPLEVRPGGAYWLLRLDIPAHKVIRSFRIPVEPSAG